MYSPIRNTSSIRKNTPEITSRTNVWAPNPIAKPNMPAPANNGAISIPSGEQADRDQTADADADRFGKMACGADRGEQLRQKGR